MLHLSAQAPAGRRLTIVLLALIAFGWLASLAPVVLAAPALTLGSYYGGKSDDYIHDVAVDSTGIYLTGYSYSNNLPNASGKLNGSTDMFVTKLNPAGSAVLWSVYIGGSDDDRGNALVSDGQGSLWVTGSTDSRDFPVTADADESSFSGFTDIVTLKLDAATGATRYATYLGGDNLDEGRDIVLDGRGGVYVAGWWGQADALVVKYDTNGKGLWGRAFGGSGEEVANALALDAQGNIWTTGKTDGIGIANAFDGLDAGSIMNTCGAGDVYGSCGADAFVSKLSPDGDTVLYSTFLGGSYTEAGSGSDEGADIAIDAQGNIFVVGKTLAANFPLKSPIQATKAGADNFADSFLTKLTPDGRSIVYSTYLGGEEWEQAEAVVVDGQGNAYVTGHTGSKDFPLKDPFQGLLGNGVCSIGGGERYCYDAFVTQVGPSGALGWSSYLGGGLDELGYGLALDGAGGLLLAGYSDSHANQGFPVTAGAAQTTKGFGWDGFVVRIGGQGSGPGTQPGPDPNKPYRVALPMVRG